MTSSALRPRRAYTIAIAAALALAAAPVLAQGTPEEREACAPDAIKLCSDTIPDVPTTKACMESHFSELSPQCQAFVSPPSPAQPDGDAPDTRAEQEPPMPEDDPGISRHHHARPAPTDEDADNSGDDDERDLRHARAVIGRLCESGVMDPATCRIAGRAMEMAR